MLEDDQHAYCSDYCRRQLDIRSSAGLLRITVLERDNLRCQTCGVSSIELYKALKIQKKLDYNRYFKLLCLLQIQERRTGSPENLLDIDHILACRDGGGAGIEGNLLDNVELICLFCHYIRNTIDLSTKKKL